MAENPFRYLQPVAPERFTGRWPLVRRIARDLAQEDGDSHAIIAGRRCGKTSLLNVIGAQLRQAANSNETGMLCVPVPLDFKALADRLVSVDQLFSELLTRIYRRLDISVHLRPPDAWSQPVDLASDWFLPLAQASELTFGQFEECVQHIIDRLRAAGQRSRLVFLIDEFDDALERGWTFALMDQLRALVNSSDVKGDVRLVVAGSRRFLDQVSRRGSPLWNVLKLNYLAAFDRQGFDELAGRAPELSAQAQEEVWGECGGHPFLAQYLLHHLWEMDITTITADDVGIVRDRFIMEESAHLEGWTSAVGEDGRAAYRVLAAQDDWMTVADITAAVANPSLRVKRGLDALCYHCLAIHDGSWRRYRRAGDMFRTWLVDAPGQTADEPAEVVAADELQRLTRIMAGLPGFRDEPRARRVLLEQAGVDHFLEDVELTGSPRTVAGDILGRLCRRGRAINALEETALGAVLHYVLELPELPEGDAGFVAQVMVRRYLVSGRVLTDLSSRYGIVA